MSVRIFYQYNEEPEKHFDFDGDTLTIGRSSLNSPTVDLNLYPDGAISRRHATLYFDRNHWWVRDSGSKHGTFYEGKAITSSTMIPSGGMIVIGDTCLRLEYDGSSDDVTGSQNGFVTEHITIDPFGQPYKISESVRLDVLSRIANIRKQYAGQTALEMLAKCIREYFGKKADHVGVVLYRDKQPIPIAFLPPEKSYVSFSLVEHVIEDRIAFIWQRGTAPPDEQENESLKKVISAMYAPITYNRRIIGVIHVDSISADVSFNLNNLEIFTEIARCSSLIMAEQNNILDFVPSVFISYSRRDKEFIKRLSSDLRRDVINVWYDDRLRAGDAWQVQLAQAIEVMHICLLVMSPSSLASENVAWELEQARKAGKTILPVLYHPCPKIPEWLTEIQYIDFTKEPQRAFAELSDAIRSKAGF